MGKRSKNVALHQRSFTGVQQVAGRTVRAQHNSRLTPPLQATACLFFVFQGFATVSRPSFPFSSSASAAPSAAPSSANGVLPPTPASDPRKDSLIEYPSLFPIKVMGSNVEGFAAAVTALAQQFDPQFDAGTVELRESSGGKYLGVTITITATSRGQLDDLYRALTSHPLVKMVL